MHDNRALYKKLDDVKRKVFTGIVNEFNSKFERNISFEDILDIAEAQSRTIHKALNDRKEVKIQHIGRFYLNLGQLEIERIASELMDSEDLTLAQAKAIATKAVVGKVSDLKKTNRAKYKEYLSAARKQTNSTRKPSLNIPLTINITKK
jgi:hypothetical protein